MNGNESRCVVTGLGLVCAVGNNVDEAWKNVIDSVSGIKKARAVNTDGCYAELGAEVSCSFDDLILEEEKDRTAMLCIKAANEAMADCGIADFENDPRACVIMGSCVGGAVNIARYSKDGRPAKVIPQMPIGQVAAETACYFHAAGTVTNIANACAAGTISIAYACDLIRAGRADIVLAGGADSFADVPFAGFLSLSALDAKGCSPFNRCEGITLGEGAGVVVVESYSHATARGAKIYCEVLGSGVSSDAHHITAPREDGEGQMEAIRRALHNSGLSASDIGYINAHGTGTGLNDSAEFLSLHTIFDEENNDLSVSSTKAATGHCLGAAGAIEAVFAIKALTEDTVPATLGYRPEDMERLAQRAGKIDFCPNIARHKKLDNVMSNSFAFGGNNASIVFSKKAGNVEVCEKKKPVCITGMGLVTPLGNGIDNYIKAVTEGQSIEKGANSVSSGCGKDDYEPLGLTNSFLRKLDNLSKLQAVSGMAAIKNAGFEINDHTAADIGIVIGTSEGALGTCIDFQDRLTQKGNSAGNAFKFPNTVYNAAGGYLSICSGIKGYNVTVTNGPQSGLAGIAYASSVIRSGQEKAMLAAGTDENSEIITELFGKMELIAAGENGFSLSDGSVTLFLEDEENARTRGAKIYGYITGYGMATDARKYGEIEGTEAALSLAIENALEDAGISAGQIDAIFGFANGMKTVDDIEVSAYNRVFGERLAKLPIIQIKERTGEGRSASAALACAHAALMLEGKIPSDGAYLVHSKEYISKTAAHSGSMEKVLITACGCSGSYTAVVLERSSK